jgi:hypothetical protein
LNAPDSKCDFADSALTGTKMHIDHIAFIYKDFRNTSRCICLHGIVQNQKLNGHHIGHQNAFTTHAPHGWRTFVNRFLQPTTVHTSGSVAEIVGETGGGRSRAVEATVSFESSTVELEPFPLQLLAPAPARLQTWRRDSAPLLPSLGFAPLKMFDT